jgi:hypothetical protein
MKKVRGCEWYQSIDLLILYISADVKISFKGPRPFKGSVIHVSSRYRIFDPGGHMIRSEHMKSCLTAQIRFMLRGPGPIFQPATEGWKTCNTTNRQRTS